MTELKNQSKDMIRRRLEQLVAQYVDEQDHEDPDMLLTDDPDVLTKDFILWAYHDLGLNK